MPPPTAIVCLTGSELTRGETRDLNGSFLGTRLTSIGVRVVEIRLIPDDPHAIEATLRELVERADIVISSGGLGPTADDLTIAALARVFGREVARDETARHSMRARILARGRREEDIPSNFYKQSEVVAGATVLQNPVGLAPGSLVDTHGGPSGRGFVVALPGVPRELKAMYDECVLPEIRSRFELTPPRILRAKVLGQPESWVEAKMQSLGLDLVRLDYGISARPGEILLKLIAHDAASHALLESAPAVLARAFGADLLLLPDGLEDETGGARNISFGRFVHDLLLARGLTVATAESCTGGLLAKELTDHAGSSRHFLGAVVAYANAAKTSMLGLDAELLAEHGAVSEPVCRAMARGARERFGSDLALSTTGVAGPDGGSDAKPVGLVWIGLAGPDDDEVHAESRVFLGDREMVRQQAVQRALDLVRRRLG